MKNYSIAMSESINYMLSDHLIRQDEQEDLCFALYQVSTGLTRTTALISEIILPLEYERSVHGNVSFNSAFFDRVKTIALKKGFGICFMHSHPFPGWQGMSYDDIVAEKYLAPRVKAITGLPLVGMTIGNDGTWSARFWIKKAPENYEKIFCESVRVVGKSLKISFLNQKRFNLNIEEEFTRTVSAWGEEKQRILSNLNVGIIGLGSVGASIAEAMVRTRILKHTWIDFDKVKKTNLDRQFRIKDIGNYKVNAVKDKVLEFNQSKTLNIITIPESINQEEAYKAALDCDVIFSCVDRPYPRFILNNLSYGNLIPVIDGGIDANPKIDNSNLDQARWKSHTVGPERICMQCLRQYIPEDVALEMEGLLDDPHYIKGLPDDHFINKGENVYIFSQGAAAAMECQFLSLVLNPRGIYYGPKEYDFNTGNIDFDFKDTCDYNCLVRKEFGKGDSLNKGLYS